MYQIHNNDGFKFIEIKFNTEDGGNTICVLVNIRLSMMRSMR